MIENDGYVPAPVLVELMRVCTRKGFERQNILDFVDRLLRMQIEVLPFDRDAAQISIEANERYGSGTGNGGKLNMLDLMVYGAAKARDLPILCTGKDYPSTDAKIHPASRPE